MKKSKHYGVPYQGNKSRIADDIIKILPAGNRLVDLFGGGGAITHCAILYNKWQEYLYNDINPMITQLFIDAVNGKYQDEKRIITREDFFKHKDTDPYVKYIWSFGNNGQNYLWGKDIEKEKLKACELILEDDAEKRRRLYMEFIKILENSKCDSLGRVQSLEHLEKLKKLKRLQALTQLNNIKSLETLNTKKKITVSNINYKEYRYQEGDVVYCDVPYENVRKNTRKNYDALFDSKEFYKWAKEQDYQVYFSSYEISDNDFYKVEIKKTQNIFGPTSNGTYNTEYLYSNKEIILNDRD